MKTVILICQLVFFANQNLLTKTYEIADTYIIQSVEFNISSPHNPRFAYLSSIMTDHGEFYIATKKEIMDAIVQDSLELNNLKIIIDPHSSIYQMDEEGNYSPLPNDYSSGISGLLELDNTEIYHIGKMYYIIRRVKYGYIDGVKLKYFDYPDEELKDYKTDSLRLFLFVKDLLPTHKSIKRHLWKRKYELPDFWKGYILEETKKVN